MKIRHVALCYPTLLSLLLGGLAATGFAPLEWWPLTLVCLALWMWLIHAAPTLKRALLNGWLFGLAHFSFGNNWIQHAFTFQDAMPHWLGYFAVVLLAAYLALYPMLAAGIAWRFRRTDRADASYILTFAAAWIASEWLRGTLFTGYAWNPLGVIWVPMSLSPLAAWVGTYALGGVTMLVAGALLLVFHGHWRFAAGIIIPVALFTVLNLHVETTPWTPPPGYPHIRVIQPDLGEEERPTDDYAENNLAAIEKLLGTPSPNPRLIVWPEGALRFPIEDGYPRSYYWNADPADIRRRIARHLGPNDIVLTGGEALLFDRTGNVTAATNSIFAIDARARLLGRYDKAHLVPYGEYLPMRPLLSRLGLQRLVPGDTDFAPGPGPRGLSLPAFGTVGMQICYEIVFSGQTVDEAHRPAFLFNPSNDSWFGRWGPPQHLAQARMRAIEEGLPIIRATPTGISAIIDSNGRLIGSIPLGRPGTLEAPLPSATAPTLFSRLGNWAAMIVALMFVALAVAFRRARR